jgi:predicted DNA-binding helix-hairpin-helix protein
MCAMDTLFKLSLSSSSVLHEGEGASAGPPPPRTDCRPYGFTPAQIRAQFGATPGERLVEVDGKRIPVYDSTLPNGRRIPLLKAMLTTACERDCNYCSFRAGRTMRRISFRADEMARTFKRFFDLGYVHGLFLSTGILRGGAATQDKLLDTAEILRTRLGYRDYLHLKIMPGAERDQVLRAMQLADRVSINLEAPNPSRLETLAPSKRFNDELVRPLGWMQEIRETIAPTGTWDGRWPSSATQFVVGAAGESDVEILHTVQHLIQTLGLRRTYFEAFSPVHDTPFENEPPEDPLRQHRLYQASYLLRDYGFQFEDLPFDEHGRLPLHQDPKNLYAQTHLQHQPIEIHQADRCKLMRIPGVGPQRADAILRARRHGRLQNLQDLNRIGVFAEQAAPYITMGGRRPTRQLRLFR